MGALWAAGGHPASLGEPIFAVELVRVAGAGCVVLHGWDPNAPEVDVGEVVAPLVMADFPGAPAPVLAVENVPSRDGRRPPEDLLHDILTACPGATFTLDLNRASLRGNLDRLLAAGLDRLVNVHVPGRVEASRLVPRHGHLDLEAAVRRLWREGFGGPYAVELADPRGPGDFVAAHRWLTSILSG